MIVSLWSTDVYEVASLISCSAVGLGELIMINQHSDTLCDWPGVNWSRSPNVAGRLEIGIVLSQISEWPGTTHHASNLEAVGYDTIKLYTWAWELSIETHWPHQVRGRCRRVSY
jgi:hypothetical protein